jgi:uncharacterized coiled-coil protein SlyX
MTTANPDDATIRFSDRKIQTRTSSTRPAAEQDWSGWEAWIESHKAQVLDVACQAAGEVIGVTAAGLEKRIKNLELELARANGVLDILKGKGAEGHKAEILDIVHQNVHQAAGELIRETTTPLENRLEVLELRLAETRGTLDVLRAKGEPQAAGELGDLIRATTTPLETRLRDLELECAQQRGVVDILRGKGLPGCLRVRGTYSNGSTYQALDVVVRDSSSFVALRDNPGACPGDGWQLIACGGKRGVAGERGPKGDKGDKGDAPVLMGASFNLQGMQIQTDRGPISLFKCVAVDPERFAIKFTAADDSTLSISLLPMFQNYDQQKRT